MLLQILCRWLLREISSGFRVHDDPSELLEVVSFLANSVAIIQSEAMTEEDVQTAQAVVQSITDDGTLDDLRVQLTKQLKQHVRLTVL